MIVAILKKDDEIIINDDDDEEEKIKLLNYFFIYQNLNKNLTISREEIKHTITT